jgi:hypothetical protein
LIGDFADELMARNDFFTAGRQFTFHNVQIRSTNATCKYAKKDLARLEFRSRHLKNFQGTFQDVSRRTQDSSFHYLARCLLGARTGHQVYCSRPLDGCDRRRRR